MEAMVIILILIILFCLFLRPSKGKAGEKTVARKLSRLPKDEYKVLNNIMLTTPKGTTQIDHIVISTYGIFVIETKNYNGWIYGGEESECWTQNIYGHKHQFYNPILQNAGHVRTLRRTLSEYELPPIIPIVAFSNKATLRISFRNSNVIYWNRLNRFITQFTECRISSEQVKDIYYKLQSVQIEQSKENRKHHIRNIRTVQERKHDAVASSKCPRCGHNLVLRKGKYGQFYGCSNYPNCKYTHQI